MREEANAIFLKSFIIAKCQTSDFTYMIFFKIHVFGFMHVEIVPLSLVFFETNA